VDTHERISLLGLKTKISALWIVVLFSMIFRDLHEFARTGFLEEILAMTSNGAEISEGLVLLAGIVLAIPITMIFFVHVLDVRANRWANIIASTVLFVNIIANNLAPDFDDMFFATLICIALLLIIWYAWKWPIRQIQPR
jgi:hypothetical protein